MGARDLLDTLAGAGVSIRLDGGRLIVSPRALLTDDLRATLKINKAARIAVLQGGAGIPACPSPAGEPQHDARPEPPEDWPAVELGEAHAVLAADDCRGRQKERRIGRGQEIGLEVGRE